MSPLLKVSPALLFFSKVYVNNYDPLFRTSLGAQFNLPLCCDLQTENNSFSAQGFSLVNKTATGCDPLSFESHKDPCHFVKLCNNNWSSDHLFKTDIPSFTSPMAYSVI